MSDDLKRQLREGDHFEKVMSAPRAADRIEELEALVAEAAEALAWFIDNDDTNQGDTPLEHLGWRTWNDVNAYWIDGLNRGCAVLAKLTGDKDD